MSPSLPAIPTAAAPIARFCGETILASVPPDEFDAANSVALRSADAAALICRAPKRALDDVSEPVTAVPSQPIMGEKTAKTAPAPASHVPMVSVWPESFMTYASANTEATVRMAHL